MHDPTTDSAITATNYQKFVTIKYDSIGSLQDMYIRQSNLGRFQWGISFEGEELGKMKENISGRRGLIPFDANFRGRGFAKVGSYEAHVFARCDFFCYIRPDLVVTVLGK